MGVDKDTTCDWVRKASEQAKALTEYIHHDLHVTSVELDELLTTKSKSTSTRTKIGTTGAR